MSKVDHRNKVLPKILYSYYNKHPCF